jgi:hypothetical protein
MGVLKLLQMKESEVKFTELELRVILKAIMIRRFYYDDNTATSEQAEVERTVYEKIRHDMKIEPYPGI